MSHIKLNKAKIASKWNQVLLSEGITGEKAEWMSEYAEYHRLNESSGAAYANASNVAGMGAVFAPQPGALAGNVSYMNAGAPGSTPGSGDLGQTILPVAMKIAAQTIGLDLVSVKPSPGPRIDLMYQDFVYDDTNLGVNDERPQMIKVDLTNSGATAGLVIAAITASMASNSLTTFVNGISGGRIWTSITASTITTTEPSNKQNYLEFLGFSRIDGFPVFRVYRQSNTAQTGYAGSAGSTFWSFDTTRNTFAATGSMASQLVSLFNVVLGGTQGVTLVSAMEDHFPGFSSNWVGGGSYPMDRNTEESTYSGTLGVKVTTKSVQIGTIEVNAALRRTEIEDIKASTGLDIVEKMKSVLVNELSQTISRQIVARLHELGIKNRLSTTNRGTGKAFDFDTTYAASVGGETTHAVQRKLITRIRNASNYIVTDGRVGPATFAVTNGALAATLCDVTGYTLNPVSSKVNSGQLYPVGTIDGLQIYVDPYMRPDDKRILLGRKNTPDLPGLVFIPYLMAQSVEIISEATMAPKMQLRSRYAIADLGFFPEKQYIEMVITDANGLLD
jgi:hypothetical protein